MVCRRPIKSALRLDYSCFLVTELYVLKSSFWLFIDFYFRESASWGGAERKRGRHRSRSRLQALSCQHTARRGARTHEPWNHDLSQSRTLNQRSHPGCPSAYYLLNETLTRGAWVAQSVKRPASAQVMISRFVSSSPTSGSALTAQSLEPALDSASLSLCPTPTCDLSLSLKNK